ncbi:NAD(P)-binding domain superfamily protein [Abortiporus biennis]
MKLIVTGATGVAGLNIYRAAVSDPSITSITLIMRREMPSWAVLPPNASDKTTTIIQKDFNTYTPELASQLAKHDAVIWALGTASQGVNEADYTRITYEYPMALAKALKEGGVTERRMEGNPFRFVYISGESADPTEKSWQMWARVKGRAEKHLAEFCNANPGMNAHVIRPGYFFSNKNFPQDAPNQRSSTLIFLDKMLGPAFSALTPGLYTPQDEFQKEQKAERVGEGGVDVLYI